MPAIAEIDFRHEEQYSYLRHKDLSIPIRSSTFEAQQRGFEDTEITTVNPMTLRGLYGNGAWLNKVKDREVRESLTEVIKESWPHDPADYEPFDEYIRKRREQYPGFLMGKYVLEKMLSALPTKAENTIRHYGARAFIQGNVISLLEYKPT